MSIDWASHYNAIYGALGVPAVLSLVDSGATKSLTVIDKTEGVTVEGDGGSVQTVRPAAVVRMTELTDNGVAADDVDKGTIQFNGKTWTVHSHRHKPSPAGEGQGELYLLLTE